MKSYRIQGDFEITYVKSKCATMQCVRKYVMVKLTVYDDQVIVRSIRGKFLASIKWWTEIIRE